MGYVVSLAEAATWARGRKVGRPTVTESQPGTGWQVRSVVLPCSMLVGGPAEAAERTINVVLARGVSQDQASQHWEDGIEEIARAEAEHQTDDAAFWARAPQLSAAWPAHWRRGMVYDFETLRCAWSFAPRWQHRSFLRWHASAGASTGPGRGRAGCTPAQLRRS